MTNAAPGERNARAQGVALVLMAGVLWSSVGLGVRLIAEADVWQILLYRSVSLSAFLFVVIRIKSGQSPLRRLQGGGWPAVVAGLSLVAAYASGIYAIQTTSVATAMLIFAAAPFMTAIIGRIVLKEKVRTTTWVSILFAILGVALMVGDPTTSGSKAGGAAALVTALSFSVFTVALRWGKATDMLPAVFLSGLFGVLITFAICVFLGLPLLLSFGDGGIALGMGVFQVGAGLVLYTIGSKAIPAAELALLSLAEVLLAPVWVWLFLGETASERTLFGGSILLAALVLNAVTGRHPGARSIKSG